MNKEDYFKYYIQGSDHYLLPRNIFDELFDEIVNWKNESQQLKDRVDKALEYMGCAITCIHDEKLLDEIIEILEGEKMYGKKIVDCFWFTNFNYQQCMGIIKLYDPKNKKYYYYVGFGAGTDENNDIQSIIDWGTKYEEEQFKNIYEELIKRK